MGSRSHGQVSLGIDGNLNSGDIHTYFDVFFSFLPGLLLRISRPRSFSIENGNNEAVEKATHFLCLSTDLRESKLTPMETRNPAPNRIGAGQTTIFEHIFGQKEDKKRREAFQVYHGCGQVCLNRHVR